MSNKELMNVLTRMPSLTNSMRVDPLRTLKDLKSTFDIDVSDISPEELELVASMSQQEFKVLADLRKRAEAAGLAAADTGNLYY